MKNNFVLITGATSGIGLQLAKKFAQRGNNLVLLARREAVLEALKLEIESRNKIEVLTYPIDLTVQGEVDYVVKDLQAKKIKLHTLVNNAGVGGHGMFYEKSCKSQLNIIDLNIRSLTEITHKVIPLMIESYGGRILNISSTAGMLPGPFQAVYYASKAYVLSFSQALSEELRENNITVTAFCPGATDTGFIKSSGLAKTKLFQGKLLKASSVAYLAIKALDKGRLIATTNPFQMFMLRYLMPLFPLKTTLKISRSQMDNV